MAAALAGAPQGSGRMAAIQGSDVQSPPKRGRTEVTGDGDEPPSGQTQAALPSSGSSWEMAVRWQGCMGTLAGNAGHAAAF